MSLVKKNRGTNQCSDGHCRAEIRRSKLPRLFGRITRAPPVGFELESIGFQFYAILDTTSLYRTNNAFICFLLEEGDDAESDMDRPRPDPSITSRVQSAMTKGSYDSFARDCAQLAIERNLTRHLYTEAIKSDGPVSTRQFLADNCIFPICSSQNLNEYMQNRYTQHGRRRGEGIVTHSMGLQLVKAVTDLRNKERNRRIIELQSRDWLLRHAEFLQTGKGVLRSQDVVNTLNAMKRRDDDFKTANCVDVKRSKHRLIGSEQLKLALWAWQHGEPEHFRILSEFNVGRFCGDRQGSLCTTRLRHLLTVRLGSHAMNLPEYPGIGFKASDVNENKTSRTDLTGGMIQQSISLAVRVPGRLVGGHVSLESVGPHVSRSEQERELVPHVSVLYISESELSYTNVQQETMNADVERAIVEGVGFTCEFRKNFRGLATHILRHVCAVEGSHGGAPSSENNRMGLWSDPHASRRKQEYVR